MFIEERHKKILEVLKKRGRVEVKELSEHFKVSEDSIRRDLRIMDQKALLTRTYGGAVLIEKVSEMKDFERRKEINRKSKDKIGEMVGSLIEEEDTIIFDGSTTLLSAVPFLTEFKRLTVITNSVVIAYELNKTNENIKVVMLGGTLQNGTFNTASIETVLELDGLNADKVFISPCYISGEWGISCPFMDEAQVKKAMLRAAQKVYIVADSSKIGKKSRARIADLEENFIIIMDEKPEALIEKELRSKLNEALTIIF